ncbi:MAG: DUF3160 domain-containing protein [Polyangiaceae bacterium]
MAQASSAAPTHYEPLDDRVDASTLAETFARAREKGQGLSMDALEGGLAPDYLPAHGLDVTRAKHYREFVEKFHLTQGEEQRLDKLGFVVVPARGPNGAGPVDVYYRVFAADLPVFVSADSVLHAWHRSYDELLESTEGEIVKDLLGELLKDLSDTLAGGNQPQIDARQYVEVARALLAEGDAEPDAPPPKLDPEVAKMVAAVHAERRAPVEFMGNEVEIDFTQFKPRGHYTDWSGLAAYFRAMMWLGYVDLRLYDRTLKKAPNPREEAAARALVTAVDRSVGAKTKLEALERFYRIHVGRPNSLAPADLDALCTQAGSSRCDQAPKDAMMTAYEAQPPASYGRPDAGATIAMRLVPQRFAYDAWVTSELTAPRMPRVDASARTMATPYEVAFALGSDRALGPMRPELAEPYAATLPERLFAVRATMKALPPTSLDPTLYDHWLDALMAVARSDVRPELPKVMRTAAWHDHKLETTLASWAELRHDTVLMVEQSMGGIGCQYPEGYVEPIPALYSELDEAAKDLIELYSASGPFAKNDLAVTVKAWGAHFRDAMGRLTRMSEAELAGKPMSADDLAFLNSTVDQHAVYPYGGLRSYDGWYAALFYDRNWRAPGTKVDSRGERLPHVEGGHSKPVVVDVHTDGDNNRVLEVATGHPELLIVVVDQGEDVAVYGGPTSSFYSFERASTDRMTVPDWRSAIAEHKLPARPAFARTYRAE